MKSQYAPGLCPLLVADSRVRLLFDAINGMLRAAACNIIPFGRGGVDGCRVLEEEISI